MYILYDNMKYELVNDVHGVTRFRQLIDDQTTQILASLGGAGKFSRRQYCHLMAMTGYSLSGWEELLPDKIGYIYVDDDEISYYPDKTTYKKYDKTNGKVIDVPPYRRL